MKILIIRFSSIGDIVLTTPVIRCIKQQVEGIELHYATKKSFKSILENNPYIDKLHLLEKDIKPLLNDLKKENFDYIIDLHNNLRTKIIKFNLRTRSSSFNKLNFQKFIYTTFKINKLPEIHIVDRYLQTANVLGVKNDNEGLDYFIPKKDEVNITKYNINENYVGIVIGAKFATKRLPTNKIIELCKNVNKQIVLLGGKEDFEEGDKILNSLKRDNIFNACGKFNLNQSASLIKQASIIVSHDTGLMHIASAFDKKIISIWGNTVPEFGMSQYVSKSNKILIEVKNLKCRPCSKIGYNKCPKEHFDCMNKIDIDSIINKMT